MPMRCLVLEGRTQAAIRQCRQDLFDNPAGEIDSSMAHEDQGQVTGNAAEKRDEEIESLDRSLVGSSKCGRGDILGARQHRCSAISRHNGPVEVDYATAAKDLLCRDPSFDLLHMPENRDLAIVARSEVHVTALTWHRNPCPTGVDQAGDAKSCARA